MESEEDGQIVDDESRPSSISTSSTTFVDRKVEMKKNMQQVSSLLNDFRGMALDYSGALQLRYS